MQFPSLKNVMQFSLEYWITIKLVWWYYLLTPLIIPKLLLLEYTSILVNIFIQVLQLQVQNAERKVSLIKDFNENFH